MRIASRNALRTCRPTAPRRTDAGRDFRSGFARRRRADAGLAIHQEHGVRRSSGEAIAIGSTATDPATGSGCASSVRCGWRSPARAPTRFSIAITQAWRSAAPLAAPTPPSRRGGSFAGQECARRPDSASDRYRVARLPPRLPRRLPLRLPRRPPAPAPPPMVSDVLVSLPDGDEGERGFITDVAVRARTDLSRALGVPAPRVTLRFHPTVGELRAGDQGTLVHLGRHRQRRDSSAAADGLARARRARANPAPRAGARDDECGAGGASAVGPRGRRHLFRGRAGDSGRTETRPVERPRSSCPDDAELLRPVSVGALSNAYARAQSCFVRDLAKRKSWRDIK